MRMFLLSTLAMIFAFGFIGADDYQQAQDDAYHYAEMVCAGDWPDYDNLKPECE